MFYYCFRSEEIIPTATACHKRWHLLKQEKTWEKTTRQARKNHELCRRVVRKRMEKQNICFVVRPQSNFSALQKCLFARFVAVRLFIFFSYSLNTTTVFYFVTECPDVTVLVWGHEQGVTTMQPWLFAVTKTFLSL